MTNHPNQQTFSREHYELLLTELGKSLNMEAFKALYLGSNSQTFGADLRLLIEDIYQPHVIKRWAAVLPKPAAPDQYAEQIDDREKIINAFKDAETRRLAPTDICKATGLDFLTVAGTPTPRGKSLLDRMVDDGLLVRDTSSGFHLYELPA